MTDDNRPKSGSEGQEKLFAAIVRSATRVHIYGRPNPTVSYYVYDAERQRLHDLIVTLLATGWKP